MAGHLATGLAGGGCGSDGGTGAGATGGADAADAVGYVPARCVATNTRTAPTDGIIASFTNPDGGIDIPSDGFLTYPIASAAAPTYSITVGALHITENAPATAMTQYLGLVMGLNDHGGCLDASAFTGIRFSIAGALSGCTLQFATGDLAHTYSDGTPMTAPNGTGPVGAFSPQTAIAADQITSVPQTLKIPFVGGPSGGSPETPIDRSQLLVVLWQFVVDPDPAPDGAASSCVADLAISDLAFY